MSINLLVAQCDPRPAALPEADLQPWLAKVPGWQLVKSDDMPPALEAHFGFDNFYQTMAFVNAVADIAHGQDHHPDMIVSYGACTLRLWTHAVNALSVNDFICAAQISALPESGA
ncbi:4a-hydroxytetrahydrobiopterin dehydratase [Roseateles koreensis]|uniref:4a-hydroxytetrahydrobiopterin dehydratase n=1 Tax=Roseateles koreensis TaxID=2987526 RepID=A0ABT5KW84_9BURK|nr:4a-hydroxytetrahydrobiopterin dehydratase [Roseateles koreensis]MDC8787196.1 4a-hydroxytetrahydrobiopterin dehydratase [Roseateles koreensis]